MPRPTDLITRGSALTLALLLAACASRPPSSGPVPGGARPGSWPDRDGPDARPPPDLDKVPNAAPRVEAIRKGGPNKPYEVLGQRYDPVAEDRPMTERGLASWYGRKFHGKPTSSGEVYNMYAMTAAHATMPIPSYARVHNPANGREVIVRVNDRGPFHPGRVIDLSYTAALKLDLLRGVAPVEVERITYEDIRTGAWMRGRGPADAPTPLPEAPVYAAASPSGAPETTGTQALRRPSDTQADADSLDDKINRLSVAAAPGFWLQLGAFSRLDGAEQLRERLARELDWTAPLLAIFREKSLHRLQLGPFGSRDDARAAAQRLRLAAAIEPVLVERR